MAFSRNVRSWLDRIIRKRILLVSRGASRKNPSLMLTHTSHLRKYLDYYSYNTDKKMARFFLMNKDRIHSILPGEGSPGFNRAEEDYNNYLTESYKILNSYENLHHRTNKPGVESYARIF
jgi:hypothetical protein